MKKELKIVSENEIILQNKSDNLLSKYDAITIKNDEDSRQATDWIKFSKTIIKQTEEDRKRITDPLNSTIKEINSRYKLVTQPLKEAEQKLRAKLSTYMKEKKMLEVWAAEHEKQRLEAEAAEEAEVLESEGHKKEAEHILEVAAKTEINVNKELTRTNHGSTSSLRDNWIFEVEDIAKLAKHHPELVMAETSAIHKLIKAKNKPLRNIPGLRIFNQPVVAVR